MALAARAVLAAILLPYSPAAMAAPVSLPPLHRIVSGADIPPPVPGPALSSGHGWIFLPSDEQGQQGYLLHAVPRQGYKRSSAGSVRLVLPLSRMAAAATGRDGTGIFLLAASGSLTDTSTEWSIATVRAIGPVAPGSYAYAPGDRLSVIATVPSGFSPSSFAATPLGTVLVGHRQGVPALQLLASDGAWTAAPLPGDLGSSTAELHVLPTPTGLQLLARATGAPFLRVWQASTLTSDAGWTPLPAARVPDALVDAPLRTIGPAAPHALFRDEGQTYLVHVTPPKAQVWRLGLSQPTPIASIDGLERATGVFAAGQSRLTVVSYALSQPPIAGPTHRGIGLARSQAPPAKVTPHTMRVIELSLLSGAVIYDAPAHTDGLLSARDFQVLWLLFIGVGVVILVVVLRSEGQQELYLPDGWSLASPLRRVAAGMIDLALSVGMTMALVGGTPATWASPSTTGFAALAPLASVLVGGWLFCTLTEWLLAASPGKLMTGARVLRALPQSPPGQANPALSPTLPQALIRNAVRWLLPPMGMMMVLDRNWRHPGDVMGKSVVAVRADESVEQEQGEDGPEL